MSAEVQAAGEVKVWVKPSKRPEIRAISDADIEQKAYRVCDLGNVACGFQLGMTEVDLRQDGSGVADVEIFCSKPNCEVTNPVLQAGLNRLAASAVISNP